MYNNYRNLNFYRAYKNKYDKLNLSLPSPPPSLSSLLLSRIIGIATVTSITAFLKYTCSHKLIKSLRLFVRDHRISNYIMDISDRACLNYNPYVGAIDVINTPAIRSRTSRERWVYTHLVLTIMYQIKIVECSLYFFPFLFFFLFIRITADIAIYNHFFSFIFNQRVLFSPKMYDGKITRKLRAHKK